MKSNGFLAKAALLLWGVGTALIPVSSGVKAQATAATAAADEFTIPSQTELGDMLEKAYRTSFGSERERLVDNLHPYEVQKITTLNGTEYRFFNRDTHTAYVFASSEYVLTTGADECNPVTTEATDCETPAEKRIAIDVYDGVDCLGHLANELNGHARKSGITHTKRYDITTNAGFEARTITLTKNPTLVSGYTQSPVPVTGEANNLAFNGTNWLDLAFLSYGTDTAGEVANQTLTHYAQDLTAVQGVIDATIEDFGEQRTERDEARVALRDIRTAEEEADLTRRIEAAGVIPDVTDERVVVYLPTESDGASLPRITRENHGNYRVMGNPDGADAAGVRKITNARWDDDGNLEVSARYVFKCGPGAANQRRFNIEWVYSHSPDNNVHVVVNPIEPASSTAPDCIYEFDIEVEGIPRSPNPEVFQESEEYLVGGDAPTVYAPTTDASVAGVATAGGPGSSVSGTTTRPTGPCTAPIEYSFSLAGSELTNIKINPDGTYSATSAGMSGGGTLDPTQLQTIEQSLADNGFSSIPRDLSGTCPGSVPFEQYLTATCGGVAYRVGGVCALEPLVIEILGDISNITSVDLIRTAPSGSP